MEHDAEIERLRQQLEERNDFLAIVAHELRNPLHTLTLQLAAAAKQAEAANATRVLERIKMAQTTLQHYAKKAAVLLELARISSQGPWLNLQRTDLAALLGGLVQEYREKALLYQIDLQSSLPECCVAHTDPAAIEHIVENLLNNAFKHSAGTTVLLSLQEIGNHAMISVADDGKGIPRDEQDRVFGKFERGSAASRQSGSGLGLWIVKLLSEGLGAGISLQSKLTGGSVFSIEISLGPKGVMNA